MLDDRQPGLGEKPLHHVLVHARRRAQHAGTDIGDPRQLEEPLDRPILAKGAVQNGKDHVQRLAAQRRMAVQSRRSAPSQCHLRFRRHQRRLPLGQHSCSRRSRRIARPQLRWFRSIGPLQQPLRRPRCQPVPGLVDTDGHYVKFIAINRLQYRSRREQRNLVLPAPSAKKNPDAQFFCHFFSIVD